jgi:murein DD-endopeptidase MepM/ murein hydrolase activator NlpD
MKIINLLKKVMYTFTIVSISTLIFSIGLENSSGLQTEEPFLLPPFYGEEPVNSWFDHQYPDYRKTTDYIVKFNGEKRYNADPSICTLGQNCYNDHDGVDFGLAIGTPVLSATNGTVTFAEWDQSHAGHYDVGSLGLQIHIEYTYGGILYRMRYGHLSSLAVTLGEEVKAGQIIGTSGSNGNSSGPHLHFDIYQWKNGEYIAIDPFGWNPLSGIDNGTEPPAPYIQDDPWESDPKGTASWGICMWKAGPDYFRDICPGNTIEAPLYPAPMRGSEIIIEDGDSVNGFTKGFGGGWK